MLEEIYLNRREILDEVIKRALKNIEKELIKIDDTEINKNIDLYNKFEENYNIKLASVCKELYLQGFRDGMNLIIEVREEKQKQQ